MRKKLSFINCYLRNWHINGKNLNIAVVSAKPCLRTIILYIIRTVLLYLKTNINDRATVKNDNFLDERAIHTFIQRIKRHTWIGYACLTAKVCVTSSTACTIYEYVSSTRDCSMTAWQFFCLLIRLGPGGKQ